MRRCGLNATFRTRLQRCDGDWWPLWQRRSRVAHAALLATDTQICDTVRLEPISKSPEEDNEASELYEAEEVLGVVFPTDEDAALPLNPSKEALHEPASHIAA